MHFKGHREENARGQETRLDLDQLLVHRTNQSKCINLLINNDKI